MKNFDKKTQIKIFKIILIIVWMITIFIFSGQQGEESGDTSRKFTVAIVQIITGKSLALDDPFVEGIQLFIRKMAHFTIYAIGGFLIMNYAYTTDKTMKQKILHSIALGGGYAVKDELHQFFVSGRSGNILDVGIDTVGVITGIFIYIIIMRIIELLINKNRTKVV